MTEFQGVCEIKDNIPPTSPQQESHAIVQEYRTHISVEIAFSLTCLVPWF